MRTEPDAPKHQGISFLLFSMDTPGIEIRPLVDMTGVANFNETLLHRRARAEDIRSSVSAVRAGWWPTRSSATSGIPSGNPDVTLSRLTGLIELMKTETIDGQRLIDHPVFRDRLMQIQGRVMAMRCNDLRVLSSRLNNADAHLARMVVKLQGTELRHELEGLAIDAMGELGLAYGDNPYLRDHGSWQAQYMFYLGLIIGGGTSQIQKNIISERGLGMPKEPKIDKSH